MRTTLNIDDSLIDKASRMAGLKRNCSGKARAGDSYRKKERKEACQTRRDRETVKADTDEKGYSVEWFLSTHLSGSLVYGKLTPDLWICPTMERLAIIHLSWANLHVEILRTERPCLRFRQGTKKYLPSWKATTSWEKGWVTLTFISLLLPF